MSGQMRAALAAADAATIEDMQAAIARGGRQYTPPDGSITLPARTWVAVAEA